MLDAARASGADASASELLDTGQLICRHEQASIKLTPILRATSQNSNFHIGGQGSWLTPSLASRPFQPNDLDDTLAQHPLCPCWSEREESNLQSPDPKSGALPLGHTPMWRTEWDSNPRSQFPDPHDLSLSATCPHSTSSLPCTSGSGTHRYAFALRCAA
jgi:hypothetical protein